MTRITIPDDFASQVHNWTSTVEICDESGQLLGTFIPATAENLSDYHDLTSPLSEAEVKRRLAQPGGRSLGEIWKDLKAR